MINSPCIKICKLDKKSKYCIGCGRSIDEIKDWHKLSDTKKILINKRINKKLTNKQL